MTSELEPGEYEEEFVLVPASEANRLADEISRLQAQVAELSRVLEHATHLNSFREFNDFIPTMRAALVAAGR